MRLIEVVQDDRDDLIAGLSKFIPDPTKLLEAMKFLKKKQYLKAALIIMSASPTVPDNIGIDAEEVDESSDSWYHFTSDHIDAIHHYWPALSERLDFLPEWLANKLNAAVVRLLRWHMKIRRYHRDIRIRTSQFSNVANRYGRTAQYLDKLVKT